jgi:hypothetical protein
LRTRKLLSKGATPNSGVQEFRNSGVQELQELQEEWSLSNSKDIATTERGLRRQREGPGVYGASHLWLLNSESSFCNS